jgi:hypothetical protein
MIGGDVSQMFLAILLLLSELLVGVKDLSTERLFVPGKALPLSIDAAFSMDAAMSWTLEFAIFKALARSPVKLLR